MSEWLYDNLGWVVLALGALFCAGMVWAACAQHEHYEAFMAECTKDRKSYECEVLWGQANPSTPVPHVYVPH